MPFIIPIIEAVALAAGTVGTFISGLGVIGTAIVGAGLSVAIGYIQQALTKQSSTGSANLPGGVNFQRQYGENVSRQVACGLVGIAGHDVYVNTYGAANGFLQQIYVLSDYYSTRLTRVAIGGEWQTLGDVADPDKGFPITSGQFANLIWIKFLDGRQTTADAALVENANPSSRWTADDIGIGETAIIASMTYDQNNNNSFPDFFFEFEGAPLYDWRKDDTVGGSGTHRLNDVTTHEYSDNPILVEYNYRYGFRINDDLFCGMDMPITDLPLDKFSVAANICDEDVDGEKRYTISIFLDCMTTHGDNLQSVALSCGALQVDGVDGSWPIVGSDQSPIATITDDDFIVGADFKFRAKRSMGDLVNSVTGNFPDPDQMWSMVGYDQQTSSDLVTLDRRTRDVNIDFPMVRSLRQADQLAWIYLYENRFEAILNGTLRPRWQTLETGDWVAWNSRRYGNFTFILVSASLMALDSDTPRNAVVSFQQRDGQIYDGITPIPIVIPTPPGAPVYASELDSFAVIPVAITGDDGRAQAAIRASWATILDSTVTSIELQYYPTAFPDSVITKTITDPTTTAVVLADGVVGNSNYTVKAKIVTTPLRTTVFNAGASVLTLDIGSDADAIIAIISATLAPLDSALRDQLETINTTINQLRMNQTANGYLNRKVVRQDLVSITGDAFAQISDVREVATDTQSALASFTTSVTAQFGDVNSSITTVETAVADVSGFAAAHYSLTLNVDNAVTGMDIFNGGAGLSGVIFTTDSFLIQKPGSPGSETPMFAVGTVNGVAGTVGINGDLVIDGTVTARALVSVSVDAYFATFGTMTAGIIKSSDGHYINNLTTGLETWDDGL